MELNVATLHGILPFAFCDQAILSMEICFTARCTGVFEVKIPCRVVAYQIVDVVVVLYPQKRKDE